MTGGVGIAGSGAIGGADARAVKVAVGCSVGAELGAGVGGVWMRLGPGAGG